MDMRFGTWNVRSLYTAGSLRTGASKSAKYDLDRGSTRESVISFQELLLTNYTWKKKVAIAME
jgi:hypothetical protein